MLTAAFWQRAFERAAKSAAQAAIIVIGADKLDVMQADWDSIGGFAAGGLVLSLLTSVVSAPFGAPESPSLVDPGSDVD